MSNFWNFKDAMIVAQENMWWLVAALVIGLVTGWWACRAQRRA